MAPLSNATRIASGTRRIRIVIADDHPLVLDGLEGLFDRERDLQTVAKCVGGGDVLAAVRTHRPDVLLLDLAMAPPGGLEVLRQLTADKLAPKVVLLTATISPTEFLAARRLGARGVLLKGVPSRLIVECVRKVHGGGEWLEHTTTRGALDELIRQQQAMREVSGVLTPREIELVTLVAAGLRNAAIAERLHISEGTVKTHLHRVFQKLDLDSRLALMHWAREKGLA